MDSAPAGSSSTGDRVDADRTCVSLDFQGHGTSFRIRADEVHFLEQMAARVAMHGWTREDRPTVDVEYVQRQITSDHDGATIGGFRLECNGELIQRSDHLVTLLDAFENHAKIEMAFRATDYLFVHAGVVGFHGSAVLMPGRSRAGKTTLVEALVACGAEYYSDEFALLDPSGLVHPYAIPLSIRARGNRPSVRASVESVGGWRGIVPLPVGLIVVTTYTRGARWRPQPISPAEAMLALMGNTVAATRPPQHTMPVLRETVANAKAIHSPRGDARAIAPVLLSELP
jgi:hypothetical protein